jgi:hypothetical protein
MLYSNGQKLQQIIKGDITVINELEYAHFFESGTVYDQLLLI